jgi:hypothetical protein
MKKKLGIFYIKKYHYSIHSAHSPSPHTKMFSRVVSGESKYDKTKRIPCFTVGKYVLAKIPFTPGTKKNKFIAVVDTSGSMCGSRIMQLKQALSVSRGNIIKLIAFESYAYVMEVDEFIQADLSGGTDIHGAMNLLISEIKKMVDMGQLEAYTHYVIVFASDGQDCRFKQRDAENVSNKLSEIINSIPGLQISFQCWTWGSAFDADSAKALHSAGTDQNFPAALAGEDNLAENIKPMMNTPVILENACSAVGSIKGFPGEIMCIVCDEKGQIPNVRVNGVDYMMDTPTLEKDTFDDMFSKFVEQNVSSLTSRGMSKDKLVYSKAEIDAANASSLCDEIMELREDAYPSKKKACKDDPSITELRKMMKQEATYERIIEEQLKKINLVREGKWRLMNARDQYNTMIAGTKGMMQAAARLGVNDEDMMSMVKAVEDNWPVIKKSLTDLPDSALSIQGQNTWLSLVANEQFLTVILPAIQNRGWDAIDILCRSVYGIKIRACQYGGSSNDGTKFEIYDYQGSNLLRIEDVRAQPAGAGGIPAGQIETVMPLIEMTRKEAMKMAPVFRFRLFGAMISRLLTNQPIITPDAHPGILAAFATRLILNDAIASPVFDTVKTNFMMYWQSTTNKKLISQLKGPNPEYGVIEASASLEAFTGHKRMTGSVSYVISTMIMGKQLGLLDLPIEKIKMIVTAAIIHLISNASKGQRIEELFCSIGDGRYEICNVDILRTPEYKSSEDKADDTDDTDDTDEKMEVEEAPYMRLYRYFEQFSSYVRTTNSQDFPTLQFTNELIYGVLSAETPEERQNKFICLPREGLASKVANRLSAGVPKSAWVKKLEGDTQVSVRRDSLGYAIQNVKNLMKMVRASSLLPEHELRNIEMNMEELTFYATWSGLNEPDAAERMRQMRDYIIDPMKSLPNSATLTEEIAKVLLEKERRVMFEKAIAESKERALKEWAEHYDAIHREPITIRDHDELLYMVGKKYPEMNAQQVSDYANKLDLNGGIYGRNSMTKNCCLAWGCPHFLVYDGELFTGHLSRMHDKFCHPLHSDINKSRKMSYDEFMDAHPHYKDDQRIKRWFVEESLMIARGETVDRTIRIKFAKSSEELDRAISFAEFCGVSNDKIRDAIPV